MRVLRTQVVCRKVSICMPWHGNWKEGSLCPSWVGIKVGVLRHGSRCYFGHWCLISVLKEEEELDRHINGDVFGCKMQTTKLKMDVIRSAIIIPRNTKYRCREIPGLVQWPKIPLKTPALPTFLLFPRMLGFVLKLFPPWLRDSCWISWHSILNNCI